MNPIYIVRFIHFLVTMYFLVCLFVLLFSVVTNSRSLILYLSIISLLLEGLIIFLNKGICPLGFFHHKAGDTKTFFELLMPAKAARLAVPFFAVLSITLLITYLIQELLK